MDGTSWVLGPPSYLDGVETGSELLRSVSRGPGPEQLCSCWGRTRGSSRLGGLCRGPGAWEKAIYGKLVRHSLSRNPNR